MRVLLILTLVWQPLLFLSAGPRHASVKDSAVRIASGLTCSVKISQSDCCDSAPKASSCHKVVTRCGCEIRPSDQPERAPDAPMPRPDRDTLVAIQICGPPVRASTETETESVNPAADSNSRYTNKTHNEIRAILGIWRT